MHPLHTPAPAWIVHIDETLYRQFPLHELALTGWAVCPLQTTAAELWVESQDRRVPCLTRLPRPDVASHFAQPALGLCGFIARVPVRNAGHPLKFFLSASSPECIFTTFAPQTTPAPQTSRPESSPYSRWLHHHERALFTREPPPRALPQISVLLTEPLATAHASLQSLLNQRHQNWTLATHLERCAEFTVLLHPGDELHPFALLEFARALHRNPSLDLIYSAEDRIDSAGRRSHPSPKPTYCEDLLLSRDITGHSACIRTELLRRAGPITSPWGLMLRLAELTLPERVAYIPKPLYHRCATTPTPPLPPEALEHSLRRRNLTATIQSEGPSSFRLIHPIPAGARVAVVTRPEDGSQQPAFSRVLHPPGLQFQPAPPADIIIFVNFAVDTFNHQALTELAGQCIRPDTGLVGGTTQPSESQAVQSATGVSPHFFAVRASLMDPAAWSLAASAQFTALTGYLAESCRHHGLKILVTPYAVATPRYPARVIPIVPRLMSTPASFFPVTSSGQLIALPKTRFRPRRYHPGNLKTWSGHLPFASDLVASLRPAVLVELGTHFGESYFSFCQAVEENGVAGRCYSVDTWKGDEHSELYGEHVYEEVSEYNRAHYSSFSFLLRDTFDNMNRQFEDSTIDLLHIDGLHTYEAVKHDFETWLPKVRPGGIVLLHDIHVRHANFGVWKLWDELKATYPNFEFVHSWGLGVIQTGRAEETPELLQTLFSAGQEDCQAIRNQYVLAADNLELSWELNRQSQSPVFASELQRLESEKESVESQMEALRLSLAREQNLRIALERSAAELRSSVTHMQWLQGRQEEELASLRPLLQQHAEEKQRRQALENSLSWRATAPVRRAMGALHVRGAGGRTGPSSGE